jgi:hypothetical protein
MLFNRQTSGFLVLDMGDKIKSIDEAYSVTTTEKNLGPCARSVFVIEREENDDDFDDNLVHYGQKVRIVANPYIYKKKVGSLRLNY